MLETFFFTHLIEQQLPLASGNVLDVYGRRQLQRSAPAALSAPQSTFISPPFIPPSQFPEDISVAPSPSSGRSPSVSRDGGIFPKSLAGKRSRDPNEMSLEELIRYVKPQGPREPKKWSGCPAPVVFDQFIATDLQLLQPVRFTIAD